MQILINIIVQKFNSIVESIVFLQHIGWLCDVLFVSFSSFVGSHDGIKRN